MDTLKTAVTQRFYRGIFFNRLSCDTGCMMKINLPHYPMTAIQIAPNTNTHMGLSALAPSSHRSRPNAHASTGSTNLHPDTSGW